MIHQASEKETEMISNNDIPTKPGMMKSGDHLEKTNLIYNKTKDERITKSRRKRWP